MELSSAGALTPPLLSSPAVTPAGDRAIQPDKSASPGISSTDLESAAKPATDSAAGRKADGSEKDQGQSANGSATQLSDEQLKVVQELEARDREVRQHEQAHASVGGQHTGAPSLEYTRGPDGRMYATGGEVSVDTSAVANDPQATVEKMRTVIAAALAPAEPSTQDRQVAAKAQALLTEALASLSLEENAQEQDEADNTEAAKESGQSELGMSPNRVSRDAAVSDVTAENNVSQQPAQSGVQTLDNIQLEMERRLVETGVFSKVFPEGSLIEQQV
ncbi:MAG: hypothetical protein KC477_05480 [Oceanospirillaceae bacterium]|nr:hypothetical protein [Oceanospirillaceae bacterium]